MRCLRCGHTWMPRLKRRPRQCPNCHQTHWDTPSGQVRPGRKPGNSRLDHIEQQGATLIQLVREIKELLLGKG